VAPERARRRGGRRCDEPREQDDQPMTSATGMVSKHDGKRGGAALHGFDKFDVT
jgi:hypothetical protein